MDDLIKSNSSVAKGSIYDIANAKGLKTEEVLAEADVIVMLDVSSSMGHTNPAGLSRYDRAKDSLAEIQQAFPGRVAVMSFSSDAKLELTGIPPFHGGSTEMMKALELAKDFDGLDTKFYLISDGSPTDMCGNDAVLAFAQSFEDPINCIFIGSDDDTESIEFMRSIAQTTGGTDTGKIDPKMLGETIKQLVANTRD